MSNFITGLIWSKQALPRGGFLFAWFSNEEPGWGGILNGRSSDFFSDEQFVKTPVMAIQDSDIHSDWHFKSHLLGNGTMSHMTYDWVMSQWIYFCNNYMVFWCQATHCVLDKYPYMTYLSWVGENDIYLMSMSHVTHNESCHKLISHVTYECTLVIVILYTWCHVKNRIRDN